MKKEKSCGAVVYKVEHGELYFLIEHMIQGHKAIPKGHMEGQETEEQTALREIREETNLEVALDTGFRYEEAYSPYEGVWKEVVYFVAEARSIDLKNQEAEVSSLEWLPWHAAVEAVTYPNTREALTKARAYLQEKLGL